MIAILSTVIAAMGLFIAFSDKLKARERDSENEGAKDAETAAELKYISRGIDDIRLDMRNIATRQQQDGEKIIRLDEGNKIAHKRINDHEERLQALERKFKGELSWTSRKD